MARIKRTLRTAEEVRNIFKENEYGFVMINNNIFDQFYEIEEHPYHEYKSHGKIKNTVTFSELDLITFIFLKFMNNYKFTLYLDEIAEYLQCSVKQLKFTMEKLQTLQGTINTPNGERQRKLVTQKEYVGFKDGKKAKLKEWYIDFDCDTKIVKKDGEEVEVPYNFFMVTINDFDLLINGKLTRKEFVLYLFLLRIYNFDSEPIYISNSKICERLNIKLYDTVQSYINKLSNIHIDDVPLITIDKPRNYNDMIFMRKEPSCKYLPTYNLMKINMLMNTHSEKIENCMETNFDKMEASLSKNGNEFELTGSQFNIKEKRVFNKWETDFNNAETIF